MTQIAPVAEGQIEKKMETWKVKTLAVGGVFGALHLGYGAYLYITERRGTDA